MTKMSMGKLIRVNKILVKLYWLWFFNEGAPRARHTGRKVIDMSTITNCNPSSQTDSFKFSKSITESATISRMQTFNYEVSTTIKVTAGVEIKKIFDFNFGAEVSTTIKSGSTFSTSRTKTTTVQSQFSRDLSFNLQSKSFGKYGSTLGQRKSLTQKNISKLI